MTFEQLRNLRRINLISFILMIAFNIASFFINVNGKSNINLLNERLPYFNYTNNLIIPYGLVLLSLFLFVIFQSGFLKNRDTISSLAADTVGWPFWQLNILNILQLITFQLGIPILTLLLTIVMLALLFIVNGNIKFNKRVNEEKLYVRNPFSFYLAWTIFSLFSLISYNFPKLFNKEVFLVALILLHVALLVYYGFFNNNIGILIFSLILNVFLYPYSTIYPTMKWLFIVTTAIFILAIHFIIKKNKKEEEEKLIEHKPYNG